MKSVLLIGMGKFGCILGNRLLKMGDEVMIVDKSEETIDALASQYTNALIADCMVIENLKSFDVPSFDACIVAIGDNFQASLEITSNLKDLGAKYVISRATTEIQKKFLLRTGADEVIFPDGDIAERIAIRMNSATIIDYIELDAEYSIFELALPEKWKGRKLSDINPRKQFGMNILTVKRDNTETPSLDGEFVFFEGDRMLVFGRSSEILTLVNKHKL